MVEIARSIAAMRRGRDDVFGPDLFSDPSWDMLLNLYIAEATGQRLQVKSLGAGAGIPSTTALRWISQLEQRGLVRREADRSDRRRTIIRLSAQARSGLESLIETLGSGCACAARGRSEMVDA